MGSRVGRVLLLVGVVRSRVWWGSRCGKDQGVGV